MKEYSFKDCPMTIAVCDDEQKIRAGIAQKILLFYPDAEVMQFESGEALLAYKDTIDIVFLDIQMQPTDGMETAARLREAGSDVTIIFITAMEDYVFQAFDVGAFHYLVKPFGQEKFYEVLRRAVEARKEFNYSKTSERPAIVIKQGSMTRKIYLCEIIYAEVFNRKIIIHLKDDDIEYYGKMADLKKQAGNGFFRTHRAYLVNMRYIVRYDAKTVWLERGQALMAKQNYSEFVKSYMQFNRKES